jgi:hypothetical protein
MRLHLSVAFTGYTKELDVEVLEIDPFNLHVSPDLSLSLSLGEENAV